MRAVALLRAVNVGGRGRVAMPALRELVESLGMTDVATYVQSGNLVFTSASGSEASLTKQLERAMSDAFGAATRVIMRSERELSAIAASHPFGNDEPMPARLHVVFLRDAPSHDEAGRLDPNRAPGDRFVLRGRELFIHYPNGQGRSKLTLDYVERQLGTVGTARNWNTVQKLAEMARTIR